MCNPASPVQTVGATVKLLTLLADNFDVLDDFHPAYPGSVTLVDRDSHSGITVQIVESTG